MVDDMRRLAVRTLLTVLALLAMGSAALAQADSIAVHCVPAVSIDGSCEDAHGTIQDAIDHADSAETVIVGTGTYDEQLAIDKALTLRGQGAGSTIIKPTSVAANTTSLFSGAPMAAIVVVDAASGATVTQVTVDGALSAFNACAPQYVGVFYRASSGTIQDIHVTNIFHPAAPACPSVHGIFVQSGNGGAGLNASAVIDGVTVDQYGKNGITCNEAGTACTVTDSHVTGRGPVDDAPQNGIQIGFGAHAKVIGNTVTDNFYDPLTFNACGILFFEGGGGIGRAKANTLSGNEKDICTAGHGPRE